MKKRVLSLFLVAGILFCSGSIMVKGLSDLRKSNEAVNSSIKNGYLEKTLIADPGDVDPMVAKKPVA